MPVDAAQLRGVLGDAGRATAVPSPTLVASRCFGRAGVLRSQIGHFRLQTNNLRLKRTQSLEQDFYFRQLLSHSDNLPHFP